MFAYGNSISLTVVGLLILFIGIAFLALGVGHMVKNHVNSIYTNNWAKKKIW